MELDEGITLWNTISLFIRASHRLPILFVIYSRSSWIADRCLGHANTSCLMVGTPSGTPESLYIFLGA